MEHNRRIVMMELFGCTSDDEMSVMNVEHEEEVHESGCDEIYKEKETNNIEEETHDEEAHSN